MFIKLVRLGRDADLRYTPDQTPLLDLACAYDIGYGQNKKTQWIQGTLWGKRAENLVDYLKKGTQIMLVADDVELETYPKQDGTQGAKLKCRVNDINFTNSKPAGNEAPANQAPAPQPAAAPQPQNNFDDFDDDVPF